MAKEKEYQYFIRRLGDTDSHMHTFTYDEGSFLAEFVRLHLDGRAFWYWRAAPEITRTDKWLVSGSRTVPARHAPWLTELVEKYKDEE